MPDEQSGPDPVEDADEDPGRCTLCEQPYELVRPGKSQPTCECHLFCRLHHEPVRIEYRTSGQVQGWVCPECNPAPVAEVLQPPQTVAEDAADRIADAVDEAFNFYDCPRQTIAAIIRAQLAKEAERVAEAMSALISRSVIAQNYPGQDDIAAVVCAALVREAK